MSYAVKVVHLMKTKKMSKREAEFQRDAIAQRAAAPSTTSKIQKVILDHLPASIKDKVTETVEQRGSNVEMSVISAGHDKYIVEVRNTVHSFSGYTREEAETIKERLTLSLGKLQGKNSTMEIEVVEVFDASEMLAVQNLQEFELEPMDMG